MVHDFMNGKKIWKIIGCGFLLLETLPMFSQISVRLPSEFSGQEIDMKFHGKHYKAPVNEAGISLLRLPETLRYGYAFLSGPLGNLTVCIDSKAPQTIVWEGRNSYRFLGNNQAINEYLNDGFLYRHSLNYLDNDTVFIEQWSRLYETFSRHLEEASLPEFFSSKERVRLYYVACNLLLVYPIRHSLACKLENYVPSLLYYETLRKAMVENPEGNIFWEYRQAFRDWISQETDYFHPRPTNIEKLEVLMDYVQQHVSDSLLASYLVDNYLTWHVRHFGIDGVACHLPYYDRKVKDLQARQEFYALYKQYGQIAKGCSAPEFCLPDTSGNSVCLNSFRGKYVYIDVWATWCVPCCKEFSYLRQLEEQLKGADIVFVGISIDSNRKSWKEKIAKEHLTGIQLYSGKEGSFFHDYKIGLVPRFILIDPQGNILNANMTRPSAPSTLQVLRSLTTPK